MVRWGDTFWGEGNRGFEVLSTNVKNGGIAIEELQRFLNERYEKTSLRSIDRLICILVRNANRPIVKISRVYNRSCWKFNMSAHSRRSGIRFVIFLRRSLRHTRRLFRSTRTCFATCTTIRMSIRRKWKHRSTKIRTSSELLIWSLSWTTPWIRWTKPKNSTIQWAWITNVPNEQETIWPTARPRLFHRITPPVV